MKKDTRKEILDTAKQLFNRHGFNEVGIRDIADAMGISNGNVTYHFKKKEHIVEALLDDDQNDTKPKTAPQTLEELDALILDMQYAVQNNAYYFWHYTQLSQLSPKIHQKQKQRYQFNVQMLKEAFEKLQLDGLVRKERFAGEYKTMIDALLLSSVYWIPFNKLKGEAGEMEYQVHAWGLIYSLLTKTGRIFADEILTSQE